jgi:hypothetical protein
VDYSHRKRKFGGILPEEHREYEESVTRGGAGNGPAGDQQPSHRTPDAAAVK